MTARTTTATVLLSGELARLTGVSTDTLRHYERKGLIDRPRRLPNGYRAYSPEDVHRVRLVRRALAVGFTLDEPARILRMRERGGAPCRQVRDLAAAKLVAVKSLLREVTVMRDALQRVLREWNRKLAGSPAGERVGLLEALAADDSITGEAPSPLTSPWLKRSKRRRRTRL